MGVILSESFASGIPVGFASVVSGPNSGSLVATYNASESSADISQNAFNAGWHIDACPAALDLRVVLDIEVITLDRGFSSASGFGCSFKSASQLFAWNIQGISEGSVIGGSQGNTADAIASAVGFGINRSFTFPTSGRYVYEFVCVRDSMDRRQFAAYFEGALIWIGFTSGLPLTDQITPIFLIRDSAYRIHSIEVYDNPTPFVVSNVALPVPGSVETFPPAWPVPVRTSQAPRRLRDIVYGGNGVIYGTIKIKATPDNLPVSRRVRLYRTKEMRLLAETWSDPVTGNYAFSDIAEGQDYTVISYDYQQTFRAVGADLFNI